MAKRKQKTEYARLRSLFAKLDNRLREEERKNKIEKEKKKEEVVEDGIVIQ